MNISNQLLLHMHKRKGHLPRETTMINSVKRHSDAKSLKICAGLDIELSHSCEGIFDINKVRFLGNTDLETKFLAFSS